MYDDFTLSNKLHAFNFPMQSLFVKQEKQQGFTLLELLIVIAIIAILSVMLIIVINPVETLRKSRDSQRISDLNTLKTAIGVYTTTTSTPAMDGQAGASANTLCRTAGSGGGGNWTATQKIWYSLPSDTGGVVSGISLIPVAGSNPAAGQVVASSLARVDGTGWIPINFESLISGSPISNLPVDPVNKINTLTAPTSTDLVYRYACLQGTLSYELDARLESNEFTTINNRMAADGGDNDQLFEVGTNLRILTGGGF